MSEQNPENRSFQQRLGGRMVTVAWLILLGMLTWFFNDYLNQQHNPNENVLSYQNAGVTEVVLERNRYGHYVASGKINGVPVTFILDTGATMVSVPGELAKKLSLEQGPVMHVNTANGVIPVHSTILDEVELGDIVLTGVRANINPYMEDEILLGMSFLKQLDFSQQGEQLTLRQSRLTR